MKRSYWSFLKAVYASAYHAFEAGVTRDDVLREIEQALEFAASRIAISTVPKTGKSDEGNEG
jgi:hypothetical protein